MLSASLKHSITIEKRTKTRDAIGNVTETWATLGTRRAQLIYNSGGKLYDNDAEVDVNQYQAVFIFRRLADFDYDCRIIFEGEEYIIQTIQTLYRREGHRVVTERRENA